MIIVVPSSVTYLRLNRPGPLNLLYFQLIPNDENKFRLKMLMNCHRTVQFLNAYSILCIKYY